MFILIILCYYQEKTIWKGFKLDIAFPGFSAWTLHLSHHRPIPKAFDKKTPLSKKGNRIVPAFVIYHQRYFLCFPAFISIWRLSLLLSIPFWAPFFLLTVLPNCFWSILCSAMSLVFGSPISQIFRTSVYNFIPPFRVRVKKPILILPNFFGFCQGRFPGRDYVEFCSGPQSANLRFWKPSSWDRNPWKPWKFWNSLGWSPSLLFLRSIHNVIFALDVCMLYFHNFICALDVFMLYLRNIICALDISMLYLHNVICA